MSKLITIENIQDYIKCPNYAKYNWNFTNLKNKKLNHTEELLKNAYKDLAIYGVPTSWKTIRTRATQSYFQNNENTKSIYNKSITYIAERIDSPVFFIFSDDIDWAKENMKTGFEQYFIDFNDASQNHEDIRLMKNCKHHIIANSTFSWW